MTFYDQGGDGGAAGPDLTARQYAARIVAVPGLTPDVPPGGSVFHQGVRYVNVGTSPVAIPDPVTPAALTAAGLTLPVEPTGNRPTRFIESAAQAAEPLRAYSHVHVTARDADRFVTLDDAAELGSRIRVQYVNVNGGEVTLRSGRPIMRGAGATAVTVAAGDDAALNAGPSGAIWLTRTVSGWWIEDIVGASGGGGVSLTATQTAAQVTVTPSGGGSAARIAAASSTAAGVMTAADRREFVTLIPVATDYAAWRDAQPAGADTSAEAWVSRGTGGAADLSNYVTRTELASNTGSVAVNGGVF